MTTSPERRRNESSRAARKARQGRPARRDRHGRGLRGRLVPATVPLARTKAEIFDDLVLDGPGNLQIPRPELRHAFVLKPLCDLAPTLRLPGDGRRLADLWAGHPDAAQPPAVRDL